MNAELDGVPLKPMSSEPGSDLASAGGDSQALELIKRAVAARATEVHVEPLGGDRVIRFRIDGRLEHHCYLHRELGDAILRQLEQMADIAPDEKGPASRGWLRLPDSLADVQVRLAAHPGTDGPTIVLSLRTREDVVRPLKRLCFSAAALEGVEQMLSRTSGLILVAGPSESGKTTTLYSLLAALADKGRTVATIEEPIAFRLSEFKQTEVDETRGITLAGGFAALVEGEADVILLSELRGAETAELAIQAASDKLVLTTLPSADVAAALAQLRALCPGPFGGWGAEKPPTPPDAQKGQEGRGVPLVGVIAERLLRRLCQQCCERLPSALSVSRMCLDYGVDAPFEVCRPMGCTRCRGMGYRDRLAVFEVAGPEHPVIAAWSAGRSEGELRGIVHASETGPLAAEALGRLADGQASVEEVKALITELPPAVIPTARPPQTLEPEPGQRKAKAGRPVKPARPTAPRSGKKVVIFAAPDDPFALRDLLVERLGMHPTDAMIRAHSAPGILPDRLADDEAEHWVSAIGELGLHSEAVPAAEILDFGHAEAVHHVRFLDEGLEVIEIHGEEEQRIRWQDVVLLSLGQVPQEVSRRYVMQTTTLTAARRTLPPPVDVPMPSGPELWVICANPLRPFRIDHKRLNYEYLGERKTDSATRNFRLFVEQLVRQAPDAYLTPATRVYLEHGSLRHYQFDSPAELRRYTEFHVMLRQRLRQQRESQTASIEEQQ